MPKYYEYVKSANESPYKVYLALTGGGQSFAFHYMKYSGASKTIAGINIPYGREALDNFCGKSITKFVSEDTALLMATKSYVECCKQVEDECAIGIGVTCFLASDNEREGRLHHIIIALHSFSCTRLVKIDLKQGLTRQQEEEICCMLIFRAIRDIVGSPDDTIRVDFNAGDYILDHRYQKVDRTELPMEYPDNSDQLVIMPGSFNPFHDGHLQMAKLAEEILGSRPTLELTLQNADKGILDYITVKDRLDTIPSDYNVVITDNATFLDKAVSAAQNGRKITFVVGADTWNRTLDPKYAGPTKDLFGAFADLNVQFLVFGRSGSEIKYDWYMSDLLISDKRALQYSNPISSTSIREGK